jgi:hypothetical protein
MLKQIQPILVGETVDQRLHNCLIIIQVANFYRRIFGDARERNVNNFVTLSLTNFSQNFAHHPAQKKNNFTNIKHTSMQKHEHAEAQSIMRKNKHAEARMNFFLT